MLGGVWSRENGRKLSFPASFAQEGCTLASFTALFPLSTAGLKRRAEKRELGAAPRLGPSPVHSRCEPHSPLVAGQPYVTIPLLD